MNETTLKRCGAIGLCLGMVALMLTLMLTALHAVGTDGALYYRLQMRAEVLPEAGLSEEGLRGLDDRLSAYLAGDALALREGGGPEAPWVRVPVFGKMQPAFNLRERTHLEDCYGLFALLRQVRARLFPWAVFLGVGGAYLLRDRRRIRRACLASPLVLLVPVAAFGLWAAIDFDGAFIFFHRVLFVNDLWLLDPRTDLLIRICPESMFMAMGARIGGMWLLILAGIPALAAALIRLWPGQKKSEDNSWNSNRAMRRAAAQRLKTFDAGGKR